MLTRCHCWLIACRHHTRFAQPGADKTSPEYPHRRARDDDARARRTRSMLPLSAANALAAYNSPHLNCRISRGSAQSAAGFDEEEGRHF